MTPGGAAPPALLLVAAGLAAAWPRLALPAVAAALAVAALGRGAAAGLALDDRARPALLLVLAGAALALVLADEGGEEVRRRDRPALLAALAGAAALALATSAAAAGAGLALLGLGAAAALWGPGREARAGAALAAAGPALAGLGLAARPDAALDLVARGAPGGADPWAGALPLALGLAPTLAGLPALLAGPRPWVAAGLAAAAPGAAGLALRALTGPRLPSGAPLEAPPAWLAPALVVAALALTLGGVARAVRARAVSRVAAGVGAASGGVVLLALAALAAPAPVDVAPVRGALVALLAAGLAAQGALRALARAFERELGGDDLARFVGAGRRNPWLAAALALAVVGPSAAPPTLGFLGLVGVAPALLQAGQPLAALVAGVALAGLGVVALRLVRVAFHAEAPDVPWGPPAVEPLVTTPGLTVLAVGLAALGVALGLAPPAGLGF